MKQFLLDILKQATGISFKKNTPIVGFWANKKRMGLGLDEGTLEEVFNTGRRVESRMKSYGTYSVSVSYKWDEQHKKYVITSCAKYDNKF